jgi:hypothetical protein
MEFLSGVFSVSGKEKTMDVIYLENQCASVMRIRGEDDVNRPGEACAT